MQMFSLATVLKLLSNQKCLWTQCLMKHEQLDSDIEWVCFQIKVLQTSVEKSSVTVDNCSSIWAAVSHTGWDRTGSEDSSCLCLKHNYCSYSSKLASGDKKSEFWWCSFISRCANKIQPWKCKEHFLQPKSNTMTRSHWVGTADQISSKIPHFFCFMHAQDHSKYNFKQDTLVLWFSFLKPVVSNTSVKTCSDYLCVPSFLSYDD